MHACIDSLVRVSLQQRWENFKTRVLSVTVWETGSLGLVVMTWAREVRGVVPTRRDGHNAEVAGATPSSDGMRRTIGD